MEPPAPSEGQATDRRGRGRRWIGFFVLLALLAGGAALGPWLYNARQQLRPEQLEAARALWREHGPRDYDLEYTVKLDRDPIAERYLVLVRDRRVVFAARDDEVLALGG